MCDEQEERIWKIRAPRYGFEWDGPLVAVWEVHLDPISDNYTPDDISAPDLLHRWADQVLGEHSDGLVPIHWFVDSPGQGKFERMPFQFSASGQADEEDFLRHYEWPEDPQTGELLNWLTIPVVDKRWTAKQANKGGFIQEATGWKPSILQPSVYVPGLLQAAGF